MSRDFAKANDAFLTQFVQVLADVDKAYTSNRAGWTADSPQVKACLLYTSDAADE